MATVVNKKNNVKGPYRDFIMTLISLFNVRKLFFSCKMEKSMHYICTADKGVKVHIEMRSVSWKSVHCVFYIYWSCLFLLCDAKDMFNALMMLFVLEDK